jgi:hypothetical protein
MTGISPSRERQVAVEHPETEHALHILQLVHVPRSLGRFLGMKRDSFRSPVWIWITEQAVEDLIAGVRSVEDLLPRRVKEPLARKKCLGC